MLKYGVPIEAILGKEVLEHGLTEDQINLFILASKSVAADEMVQMQFAFAASQSKEAAKEMQRTVDNMHNRLKVKLVKETYGKQNNSRGNS